MLRTFVLGDIHGAYKALVQCLEASGFDREGDRLIFLGDAGDGWSQAPECIEELMTVRNLVYILGNHDIWLMEWLAFSWQPRLWLSQGGRETIEAYSGSQWRTSRERHLDFLRQGVFYYLDNEQRLFVHGGIRPGRPLEEQDEELLVWDRNLFYETEGVPGYREIYIGHTPTVSVSRTEPLNHGGADNIWRMDTGAGWNGPLSIMDVDTGRFWQSDIAADLYAGEKGRV